MTFRIVDLITRLDGTRQRIYRMCDASGGDPCGNVSDPPPADNTLANCPKDRGPGENENNQGQGGGGASRQGDKDWDHTRPAGCGGNRSLSMLQDQLRRSLQEPPASPW